ncbi:hypothetical protein Tsubulata_029876 [Turnera subulata]|uniref:Peptidase metallopeptidase domain-containing protein n=1 Tax=Turnera subulata TaxID=218843 RepID=A0A9Q0FP30_9ROSI|nr:hypothetical protein Tsubulata_029876 [Turnera subulata]
MASNTIYFSAIIALLLHAVPSRPLIHEKSQLEFIQTLQDGIKGDKKAGIHQLKLYLQKFGYLNDSTGGVDDDSMEGAIRTYQINFNLKPTGVLDDETVATMMMPRCGVADITHGKTRMKAGNHQHTDYVFYEGEPKWPLTSKILTWKLMPGSRQDAVAPVRDYALLSWAGIGPFAYEQVGEDAISQIAIGFRTREGGDPIGKMDGPYGVLAYAFPPQDGHMYFDGDENWAINAPTPQQIDMGTVALHELGHILGLGHSSDPSAVMFPIVQPGTIKGLEKDDIAGIEALYNITRLS